MKRKKKVIKVIKIFKPEKKKPIQIMVRKDGKVTCFVCYKPLHDVRDLQEMKGSSQAGTDFYNRLLRKVNESTVHLPFPGIHNSRVLYRHANCHPGGDVYMKNKRLKKHFKNTLK